MSKIPIQTLKQDHLEKKGNYIKILKIFETQFITHNSKDTHETTRSLVV